jgi:hypothetical protein
MTTKLTTGRQLAQQRARTKRMVLRLLERYDKPTVTDTDIKVVLTKVLVYLGQETRRYNAKPGGLGK